MKTMKKLYASHKKQPKLDLLQKNWDDVLEHMLSVAEDFPLDDTFRRRAPEKGKRSKNMHRGCINMVELLRATTILPAYSYLEIGKNIVEPIARGQRPQAESSSEQLMRALRTDLPMYVDSFLQYVTNLVSIYVHDRYRKYLEAAQKTPFVLLHALQDVDMMEAVAYYYTRQVLESILRQPDDAYRFVPHKTIQEVQDMFLESINTLMALAATDSTLLPLPELVPDSLFVVRPGQILKVPSTGITYVILYHEPVQSDDPEIDPESMVRDGRNTFTKHFTLLPFGAAVVVNISHRAYEEGVRLEHMLEQVTLPEPEALKGFAIIETKSYTDEEDPYVFNAEALYEDGESVLIDERGVDPLHQVGLIIDNIDCDTFEPGELGDAWYFDMSEGSPKCRTPKEDRYVPFHNFPFDGEEDEDN